MNLTPTLGLVLMFFAVLPTVAVPAAVAGVAGDSVTLKVNVPAA